MKHFILLITPEEQAIYGDRFIHARPVPLLAGVLQAGIRSEGYSVATYDLTMAAATVEQDYQKWLPLYDTEHVLTVLKREASFLADGILERLLDNKGLETCDYAGISLGSNNSIFEIHTGFLLADMIKRKYQKPVMIGGINVDYLLQFSGMFDSLWKIVLQQFDCILDGPGERSISALLAGKNGQTIPGSVIMGPDGTPQKTPVEPPSFICPDFAGLDISVYQNYISRSGEEGFEAAAIRQLYLESIARAQFRSYNAMRKQPEAKTVTLMPYYFNSGCVYRCAFCTQSRADRTGFTQTTPEAAADCLENLIAKYGSHYFRFFNNAFNLSMPFARQLCAEIKKRKLKLYWSDCGRFNGVTEKDVYEFREAGCRKLVFGMDSASPRILDFIDKRLNLKQVKKVTGWCRDAGISAELEVIVGMPYEGTQDFEETRTFLNELISDKCINAFHVNRYFVIPCSRFGSSPEEYGIRLHYDPEGYRHKAEREQEIFTSICTGQTGKIPHRRDPVVYSEIKGRSAEEIIEENMRKYQLLRAISQSI